MTLQKLFTGLILCTIVGLSGCSDDQANLSQNNAPGTPKVLDWTELMPADYDPSNAIPDINLDELEDNDPRTDKYMKLMRAVWDKAPVIPELDGQKVKIPGFVVPIEYDEKQVSEFLLVPYFGACIHTPPPPSNQMVYVSTGGFGPSPDQLWDPIWVTGTLNTEHVSSELGEAGYRMSADVIEPYEYEDDSAQ